MNSSFGTDYEDVLAIDERRDKKCHKNDKKAIPGFTFTSKVAMINQTADVKFEMTCNGWGAFNMPITIHWNRNTGLKTPLKLEH